MFDINTLDTWRILVVDDEPDNSAVILDVMGFLDAAAESAQDGAQGLEKIKIFHPNIIMLDLSMPVMDGWETLKRIRADSEIAHLPIIAFTAHAMEGDAERALEEGFDGYLTKPVRIVNLVRDLQDALNKISQERLAKLSGTGEATPPPSLANSEDASIPSVPSAQASPEQTPKPHQGEEK
jgi:two-component system, cell cycle response regulator DivK